ncbi:MAG TPA: peptidoglycan editing factor PgeF [Promineifilum sp.]|nr:peptidoglycan editing factor PgeF [Promineifilum sp.]
MKSYAHDNLQYFRFQTLPGNGTPANAVAVDHAVFSRRGGVSVAPFDSLNLSMSVPDERDRVYANRRRVYGLFGRDTDTVVHAHLVHGAAVARVSSANNGTWVEHVDGLITNQSGTVLSMNFADCTPIFLYDPRRHAIGLGHAGWRGTMVDLPGAMVRAMTAQFGSDPADLVAAVGPCIGPCCYEVGEEVIAAVEATFTEPDTLFRPLTGDDRLTAAGHRFFDMPQANQRNLTNAGVRNIETSGLCTACRTDLFFSHRAEKGRTGRFGTVFALGRD